MINFYILHLIIANMCKASQIILRRLLSSYLKPVTGFKQNKLRPLRIKDRYQLYRIKVYILFKYI